MKNLAAAKIEAFGKTQTRGEWAREYGIHRNTLDTRLDRGLPLEQAVSIPAHCKLANLEADAGHPGATSWYKPRYEDDDHCWYVVANHPEGLTLEQVGQLMGVTRERIRQIEAKIIRKVRKTNPQLADFLEDHRDHFDGLCKAAR
jgi:hypothetical protein